MKEDSFIAWVFLLPPVPVETYRVVTLLACPLATVLMSDKSNLTLIATELCIGVTPATCIARRCHVHLHLKVAWQNKPFGNRSRAYLTQDGRSSPHFTFLALQFLSDIVSALLIGIWKRHSFRLTNTHYGSSSSVPGRRASWVEASHAGPSCRKPLL